MGIIVFESDVWLLEEWELSRWSLVGEVWVEFELSGEEFGSREWILVGGFCSFCLG